jgi:hypothetical protein
VKYPNQNVADRFGNNNLKAGSGNRMDFRGRDGQPGGGRPGVGDGNRATDRAGDKAANRAGNRGDRAGAADRAKGGDRAGAANRAKGGGNRAAAANRSRGGGSAFSGASSARAASAASARGQMSLGGRGGGGAAFAGGRGGGGFAAAGGGGFRGGGGGGGFRGGGGGRRSDIELKHDVVLLGHLANGLGYYRFSYIGSNKPYVGVIAQEVQGRMPEAVTRGADGYLRVHYERLGLKFRSYADWLAGGARIPSLAGVSP